jgi:hypothetical protein
MSNNNRDDNHEYGDFNDDFDDNYQLRGTGPGVNRENPDTPYSGPTAEQDAANRAAVSRAIEFKRANREADIFLREELMRQGGDESKFVPTSLLDVFDPEPVELDASGVLLSTGVHRISGPAGSGKTRFAYWCVLQRVRAGEKWAICDLEMGASRTRQAMRQLGATDHDLGRLFYIDMPDNMTPDLIEHGRALARSVVSRGCSGILYDSMTPFLAASGMSENDPQGVRDWTVSACSGTECAIIIDHTGHFDSSRGRGSSDKGAVCDVDLIFKAESPFAIGKNGQVSIQVNKDRSGTLPAREMMYIDVECDEGTMVFIPGNWEEPIPWSVDSPVEEILELLILKYPDRDYARAGELQKEMKCDNSEKTILIREAVEDGRIILKRVGTEKRYSLPD